MSEQEASPALQAARARLAEALTTAGNLIIASLDSGSTPERNAAIDAALEDAKSQGIVLNELWREEGCPK